MTVITETFDLNNGIKMPKVGFGTWQTRPGKETYDAVTNALKAGYRFLDTAKAYENEQSVGEALADFDIDRSEVFVQTKLPGETKTYEGTLRDFESSLKALNLDYVDSYIIHAPGHGMIWGQITMTITVMSGAQCKKFMPAVVLSRLGCLTLTLTTYKTY